MGKGQQEPPAAPRAKRAPGKKGAGKDVANKRFKPGTAASAAAAAAEPPSPKPEEQLPPQQQLQKGEGKDSKKCRGAKDADKGSSEEPRREPEGGKKSRGEWSRLGHAAKALSKWRCTAHALWATACVHVPSGSLFPGDPAAPPGVARAHTHMDGLYLCAALLPCC